MDLYGYIFVFEDSDFTALGLQLHIFK